MTGTAATVYFFLTLPILFYIVFTDLRYMRIFNWTNIALFVLFFIPAFFFFDIQTIAWQLGIAAIVLVIGYLLNLIGLIGGGDAKFLPAATPYIMLSEFNETMQLLFIFVITSFSVLIGHRALLLIPGFRNMVAEWVSWNKPKFGGRSAVPYGLILAGTLSGYLFIQAFLR
ncbi:MAG: prepilin peptidase [Pseudomonadota bacterium]